jgi:hypothetical protein
MMEHRGFTWDFIDIIGQVVDKMSHMAARIGYQRRRHPAQGGLVAIPEAGARTQLEEPATLASLANARRRGVSGANRIEGSVLARRPRVEG